MDTADKLMKVAIDGEVDDEVETVADDETEVVEERTVTRRRADPPEDGDPVVVVED